VNVRRQIIMLVTTVVIIVGTFAWTLASDNRPALGLDLQGGISIVLFPVKGTDTSALDTAVDIIRQRVDGLGIAEPEVQRQGNTIVVDLPGVKEREKAEEQVGQTAELRFRPVLQTFPWDTPLVAESTTTTAPGATTTTTPGATTTAPTTAATTSTTITGSGAGARTVPTTPIAAVRPAQETATTVAPTATATTVAPAAGDTTTTTAPAIATPKPGQTCKDVLTPATANVASATVILPGRKTDSGDPDACYLLGPTVLNGRNISSASSRYDSNTSSYVADITFKTNEFVDKVAGPYVNKQIAIELDGVVQSAPTINPGITGKHVQISGSFSKGEASDLARLLRYGALPVQFDRDQQTVQSISPTLGKDQLHAGIVAGIVGLIMVALYMLAYYRLLGLVVICGLALTGLLFFTLTSYLSASRGLALTLAGVTGLIVSVGVTVDSYVVYFERLKDEIRSGKTVRSSLDSGFRRAFRTIIAADLVSLLGAVVLYWLAAGSVRGFAFFLGISTAIDLVLAYTFMHPFVTLLARRPNLVRLPGVGIAAGLDVPEVVT
jgi:preprotein translocase subunit SecD